MSEGKRPGKPRRPAKVRWLDPARGQSELGPANGQSESVALEQLEKLISGVDEEKECEDC
jgi:hypothetical protein